MSEDMKKYFKELERKADECYRIAEKARKKGLDPHLTVEIPRAKDLAERVEELVGVKGIAKEIREMLKKEKREIVAILMAKKLASKLKEVNVEEALDKAVRVGLAILTEGILVAPLEGISEIKIGKNFDGSNYVQIFYAGPIRSAGGTAQALSVLIADVVRKELDIDRYKPTEEEIERYKEEIQLYNRKKRLQYMPTMEEVDIAVRNCPVCIDGDGTEDYEVSGYRDLPRVPTNKVRGGMCLVLAEGLLQKAPKIQGYVEKLKIDGWDFITKIAEKRIKAKKDQEEIKIEASDKYISKLVVGRPIFAHPMRPGGFRLRYGRCRAGGLATIGFNPATMIICGEFIAIGTQIMTERPGKAGGAVPCDSIEGPIVMLKDGRVLQINDYDTAMKLKDKVVEIIDLGEILIPFGEFLENNHPLLPSPFTIEWWVQELRKADADKRYSEFLNKIPSPEKAFEISEVLGIPLHPHYNLFWHDVSVEDVLHLRDYVAKNSEYDGKNLKIKREEKIKNILKYLGVFHEDREGKIIVDERYSYPLLRCLGLEYKDGKIYPKKVEVKISDPVELVSKLAGVKIMPRSPIRIGARMGRPEKADVRKMKPPVHVLFPVGDYGGSQRLVNKAAEAGRIEVEVGVRICPKCGKETPLMRCDSCKTRTEFTGKIKKMNITISEYYQKAMKKLSNPEIKGLKGVKGLMSANKTPEMLEKGILRAKYGLWVFKDGTIRYDMSDIAITHFRPSEIGLSVQKARELGYVKDYMGRPLESEDQICELKVQDIIIPMSAAEYMVNVAKFIDELLEKVYGMQKYYNVRKPEDLIGHLVVGLAPHTSGGVLARIIGFTDAQPCFAHPFFHAAKRRNCDGDEDSIILLLDALLNFSREYLPVTRGGMMDAPLVLSLRIDPSEIDKEALNVDVMDEYPLEFYYATLEYKMPDDVLDYMDIVKKRLGTEMQYEGFKFTHDTTNIAKGPLVSSYKTLGNMMNKAVVQLELAKKTRAVSERDVAERLIASHLLPDIQGNLKKFGMQQFRCTKCNKKYRRIPLSGKCENCGTDLKLTVSEGNVTKYVELVMKLADEYDVNIYLRRRIENLHAAVKKLFPNMGKKKVKEKKKASLVGVKKLGDFV